MKLQYARNKMALVLVVVMMMVLWVRATSVAAQTSTVYSCFPTCSETDERSLVLAGSGLNTLPGGTISIQIGMSRTESNIEIGFFIQLVQQVPVRRLIYLSGFEHLPRVRDRILEDLATL